MKKLCSYILSCMLTSSVCAQDSLIRVQAGTDLAQLYAHVFRYPDFLPGTVLLNDGDSIQARMNYNYYEGSLQFIQGHDTLLLDEKNDIRYIVIASDTFYKAGAQYALSLGAFDFARLVVVDRLRLHDEQRIGALGLTRPAHTIDSKNSFTSWQTLGLQLNRDLIFSRQRFFYYLQQNTSYMVNRKNLQRLFSFAGNKELAAYEKRFNTDYKNEDDLLALFQYMKLRYKTGSE